MLDTYNIHKPTIPSYHVLVGYVTYVWSLARSGLGQGWSNLLFKVVLGNWRSISSLLFFSPWCVWSEPFNLVDPRWIKVENSHWDNPSHVRHARENVHCLTAAWTASSTPWCTVDERPLSEIWIWGSHTDQISLLPSRFSRIFAWVISMSGK